MICLNLKTYSDNIGPGAYSIFDEINKLTEDFPEYKDKIALIPNFLQINELAKNYPNINVISQNADPIELGKTTGKIPADLLKISNIKFTLYNHSENRSFDEKIVSNIEFIQNKGIKVIACCESIDEAKIIINARPYAVAYEPPELIGSLKSVSTEKPEIIKSFVEIVKDYSLPYIGAGISNTLDIKAGKEYGAKGFIIAKAFHDAANKYLKTKEFLEAFS